MGLGENREMEYAQRCFWIYSMISEMNNYVLASDLVGVVINIVFFKWYNKYCEDDGLYLVVTEKFSNCLER